MRNRLCLPRQANVLSSKKSFFDFIEGRLFDPEGQGGAAGQFLNPILKRQTSVHICLSFSIFEMLLLRYTRYRSLERNDVSCQTILNL